MLYSEEIIRTYKGNTKGNLVLITSQTHNYDENLNVTKRGKVYYTINNGYDTIDLTENDFADLCKVIMDMGKPNAD